MLYEVITDPLLASRIAAAAVRGFQSRDFAGPDTDMDTVCDSADNCPTDPNPGQEDLV